MIAELPPYKRRTPKELARIGLIILLILSPLMLKVYFDESARESVRNEFKASRAQILARIDAAVVNGDLTTLTRIHNRYTGIVKDNDYRRLMEPGLASLTARETQMQLSASRNLDISRNREETSARPDTTRPQLPPGMDTGSTLSVLPY